MAHGFNDDKNKVEIADYIVESGTEGYWFYEKYNSGLLKAWYRRSATTISLLEDMGNGWYRNRDANPYTIEIPEALSCASIRQVNITVMNDLPAVVANIISATTLLITYYVSHLGSVTNYPSAIQAELIGTWSSESEVE